MTLLFYFVLSILVLELLVRLALAYYYKTLGTKNIFEVLSNPEGGMDWRVFSNFGKIESNKVSNLFRFSTQSSYMGISEEVMKSIMAEANHTDVQEVERVYTGSGAFEKTKYRPFVGFSNLPDQKLNYVELNALGFQGQYQRLRKPPNTKRVLILGGSVAFGIGCTSHAANLTNQLEKILNEQEKAKGSETRWEVINLAFVASQSISELNQALIYGPLFAPDYIIQLSGFNDLYFFLTKKPRLFMYHFQDQVINYLSSSFLDKMFIELSKHLFLIRVLLKVAKFNFQPKEGQLYTVW